jgi:TldD protein
VDEVHDFSSGGFRINYTCVDGKFRFEDQYQVYGSQFSELPHRLTEFENYLSESRRFLHAPVLAPGHYKVIFKPEVTGVFTHESFGHKSEADFYIGNEESLKEWEIGKEIAAKGLNIVDSGAHPGTSGYCPFDDDGMPAQKTYLIKDGKLAGRLHSLETAMLLNERPTGNSRALNFEFEPIVRMTSTYIEPGDRDLADIIRTNAGAILVEGYKHGSGDSTFTIAPVRGYQVDERGELQPVRVMCISGSVLATLKNVKAISKDFDLYNTSIGGCGKMGQMPLPVAFGGPYILVEGMMVS